jgi:tetratricopeptide (TPR) repeat protein
LALPGAQLRAFVWNAWVLLGFQLLAAAAALIVTIWATFQVRPLLDERERLRRDIASLKIEEKQVRESLATLQERVTSLREELKGARDATPVLTRAINAFHKGQYANAIAQYDEALKLNPGDPYVYNLKSYSQFKTGDFTGAVNTLRRGLEIDKTYDWGYFDLARYQCAAGSPHAALQTIKDALDIRGKTIQSRINFFLTKDGEFRRLCSDIVGELRKLAG